MTFFVWMAIGAAVLVAAQVFSSLYLAKQRRSGRYPEHGKATMADVERLVSVGSHAMAVRCYREIHGCSLRDASDAVRALAVK